LIFRPKKTKINLDKNSLQELMQEIYNDCTNIMNSARKELTERKSRSDIEDINDEYQMGKVNNETLKIIETTIDKKLALAKLQSQIIGDKKESDDQSNIAGGISEQDKDVLRQLFKEKSQKNNTEYDVD
jgi:hypothetical protein